MRRPVLNSVAIKFADMFYERLMDGWPIDVALVSGRVALTNSPGSDNTTDHWTHPVLFMRAPAGRLFIDPEPANALTGGSRA